MEKGNLIVSTRGKEQKIKVLIQLIIFFAAFLIMYRPLVESVSSDGNSSVLAPFIMVAIFFIATFSVIVEGRQYESYVDVYEGGIYLRTAGGYTKQPEDIQLKYTDITNISASGYKITIYTSYSNYQVYVQKYKKPEQELAVNTVRKRMGTEGGLIEEGEVITETAVAKNEEEMKKNNWKALLFIVIWIVMIIAIVFFFR